MKNLGGFLSRLAPVLGLLLMSSETPGGASDSSPADYLAVAAETAEVRAEPRLRDAIEILLRVPAGRALLQKGQQAWHLEGPSELIRVLRWGTASRTDAVLTRHLDPKTGREYREREVM